MSDLAVIVPSRGRPQNIAELVKAWDDTTSDKAKLFVAVDDDDPSLDDYLELSDGWDLARRMLTIRNAPGNMVVALNQVAALVAPKYFAVGFMGDDHRPRTPDWDLDVVAQLRKLGTGIVTGRDGFREDHLPTWCAMTSNIVRILGYMAPPGLHHMYVDNAWLTLGAAVGGFSYLDTVLVEHMHPFAGKAPSDEGYERVNDAGVYARDAAMFARWCRDDLPAAVDKLAVRPGGVD